jgi:hypothetical protein
MFRANKSNEEKKKKFPMKKAKAKGERMKGGKNVSIMPVLHDYLWLDR